MFGLWVDLLNLIKHRPLLFHILEVLIFDLSKLVIIFKFIRFAYVLELLFFDISHDSEILSELTPLVSLRIH